MQHPFWLILLSIPGFIDRTSSVASDNDASGLAHPPHFGELVGPGYESFKLICLLQIFGAGFSERGDTALSKSIIPRCALGSVPRRSTLPWRGAGQGVFVPVMLLLERFQEQFREALLCFRAMTQGSLRAMKGMSWAHTHTHTLDRVLKSSTDLHDEAPRRVKFVFLVAFFTGWWIQNRKLAFTMVCRKIREGTRSMASGYEIFAYIEHDGEKLPVYKTITFLFRVSIKFAWFLKNPQTCFKNNLTKTKKHFLFSLQVS